MTVHLDASALVALGADEPAAEQVERLLRRDEAVAMNAVNYSEAIDQIGRGKGIEVGPLVAGIVGDIIAVTAVDQAAAEDAAQLRRRHYHRRDCPVSLADCFLVATARGGSIATSDVAQAAVARAEGVEIVELPASTAR